MARTIITTPQARRWLAGLSVRDRSSIVPVIEALARFGEDLNRSVSKPIRSSQHHEMRELRSLAGNLRVLCAIDPRDRGILLVGGDKTGNWDGWYRTNVPLADRAYTAHLRSMGGGEGWGRTGDRSLGR